MSRQGHSGRRKQTGRTKAYGLEQTPEQKRWQARHEREREAYARFRNTLFGFWMGCRTKRCRRVRACAGDTVACFERNWPSVPAEAKVWYRALGVALKQGHSRNDAASIADAEVKRWQAHMAQVRTSIDAAAPPARATREPDSPVGPRVRRL